MKSVSKPSTTRRRTSSRAIWKRTSGPDATVYSDEMKSYEDLPQPHEAVQHSTGEFVRGAVHTNSLESFWSMLKRGYVGIYRRFSQQHLDRYVKECAKRRSMRELDTIDQTTELITQFWSVWLSWTDLVAYRAAAWSRSRLLRDAPSQRQKVTAQGVVCGFVDHVRTTRSRIRSCPPNESSSLQQAVT